MTARKNWCQYECGREAKLVVVNGKPTTCWACYKRMEYALQKGTTWMIKRMRQIGSWNASLADQLGDVAKKKNKKRRAA